MGEQSFIILTIGILAQICFSCRQLIQWWESEKAKSIQSPISFWVFSLVGSIFFLIYGLLRLDFAIVLGQVLNYYIYCRNLHYQGLWNTLHHFIRVTFLSIPVLILGYLYVFQANIFVSVFDNDAIGGFWLLLGTIGYLIFTVRFIYQWYVSETLFESKLPIGFFVLSILGSIMIIVYGWYRADIILIVGYLGGLVIYFRNLMIHYNHS